jgi:hypothetical protein
MGCLALAVTASPILAQDHVVCYLNFDGNPSGADLLGCPSRINVVIHTSSYTFTIGPPENPDDPNCLEGLLNPPETDDAVRDHVMGLLAPDFYVRAVGDTGLLIRRSKSPDNVAACSATTSDTNLRVRVLQVEMPALFIDLDHQTDGPGVGADDGGGQATQVSVNINGVNRTIPVALTDPDHTVAGKIRAALAGLSYTVNSVGSAVVVRHAPAGAVLFGSVSVQGQLTGTGIVPPICTGVNRTSARCGEVITLTGAGFVPFPGVTFGSTPAETVSLSQTSNEQQLFVRVPNVADSTPRTITLSRAGFDDCCPRLFAVTGDCESGGGTSIPAGNVLTSLILLASLIVVAVRGLMRSR